MTLVEPGSTAAGLTARVRALLTRPKATWEEIDQEPGGAASLYLSYVMPLAAVGPVAGFIGILTFGNPREGVAFKPSVTQALIGSVSGYVAILAGVFLLGLVINAFAPAFGGARDRTQALKVAAYSGTPGWVAGVLLLYPPLSPLASLAGLWGLYLLYLGLLTLMKPKPERAASYVVLSVVAAILLSIVVLALTRVLVLTGQTAAGANTSGAVASPSPANAMDMSRLEAAGRDLGAAAQAAQTNPIEPVDPDVLKTFLPAQIAGYPRMAARAGSLGSAAATGGSAEGTYAKGDGTFTLTVTDLGEARALAGIASAFNVESSTESGRRYDKIDKVDGRMTTESYDRASKHGSYGMLVAERFMVQAEGDAVAIEDLRAAVMAVNLARLGALAARPAPDKPVPPGG